MLKKQGGIFSLKAFLVILRILPMKQILATAIFLVTLFLTGCGGEKYGAGVDPDAQ